MPERLRLYLDQMLNLQVAETLREEGYDVVRASEAGQSRSDDYEILQKAISKIVSLLRLMTILGIGRFSRSANIQGSSGSK